MTGFVNILNYEKDGSPCFHRAAVQRMFGISNRKGWRLRLIACGFDPDDPKFRYNWDDIWVLACIDEFLNAKKGHQRHRYVDFAQMVLDCENDQVTLNQVTLNKDKLKALVREFKLNPDQLLEEIKDGYYSRAA